MCILCILQAVKQSVVVAVLAVLGRGSTPESLTLNYGNKQAGPIEAPRTEGRKNIITLHNAGISIMFLLYAAAVS